MAAVSTSALLQDLRERIRRIERRPPRRAAFEASGLAEVDGLLPGGGFPRGALSELAGEPGSGKTAIALAAMARAQAAGAERQVAFVDGRGEIYPPAVAALGVDLERLLIVRPPPDGLREALWAAEALLSSGAFELVAVDPPPVAARRPGQAHPEAMARRLVAAAEKGGAVGLWLAAWRPGQAPELRVPAAVRLAVARQAGGQPLVRRVSARGAEGAGEAGHGA